MKRMKSCEVRLILMMIICLKTTNVWASNYESPAEAFVVGALSWLFFIGMVFIVRWIIRQVKNKK